MTLPALIVIVDPVLVNKIPVGSCSIPCAFLFTGGVAHSDLFDSDIVHSNTTELT